MLFLEKQIFFAFFVRKTGGNMQNNNLISVIIPCYNAEKYISDCIESVLNQTYKEFEIIFVNNNSTDNSTKIIQKYIQKYPSIISLFEEKRKGASIARNTGLKKSKGNYIQFLDADDIIDKNKFKKQLEKFKQTDADVVVSDRIIKNETLKEEIERITFEELDKDVLEVAITKIIITGNPLYKREIVKKIQGYNENLSSAQDWDFHIRLVLADAKFVYLSGFYFISRQVSNSLSSDWIKVSNQGYYVIKENRFKIIKAKNVTNKSLYRIHTILYLSAVNASNTKEQKIYIKEINKWLRYKNISNLQGIKKKIVKILGYRVLCKIERIRKK